MRDITVSRAAACAIISELFHTLTERFAPCKFCGCIVSLRVLLRLIFSDHTLLSTSGVAFVSAPQLKP